jgi:DNA-binding response OmpR family regulator
MSPTKEPLPNAVVATRHAAVRDFLIVHLQDRGFAVACAEEPGWIAWFANGAAAIVADFDLWQGMKLTTPDPPDLLLLSESPSTEQAMAAASAGAVDYLAIPFASTKRLARTLDELAARASARNRIASERGMLEPVG